MMYRDFAAAQEKTVFSYSGNGIDMELVEVFSEGDDYYTVRFKILNQLSFRIFDDYFDAIDCYIGLSHKYVFGTETAGIDV